MLRTVTIWTMAALLLIAAPARGQAGGAGGAAGGAAGGDTGNEEEPPALRVTAPGKGPQIPFDEARWEFWWYFNREPLLNLKPTLLAQATAGKDVDVPFQKLTPKDRDQNLIPGLVNALRDQNPELRIAALHALAKTHEPSARPALYGMLHDEQFLVRVQAILALGVWGNTMCLPRLEQIVRDGERELQERLVAGVALGLVGGPLAAESFKQLLAPTAFKELPTMVQSGLAYGVGLCGDSGNAPLVRSLLLDKAVSDLAVRAYLVLSLGKCADAADADALLRLLSDSEHQTRRSAAIALGALSRKSGDARIAATLAKAAHEDADLMVRNFAIIALGYVGGAEAVKVLRTDLAEATKATRPFVALALGIAGEPESVPLLLAALKTETEPSYRGALCISLGLHRDGRAAPDLRKALKDAAEPVLAGYCALALGLIRDVQSVPELQQLMLSGTDVELLPNAATALGLLGARSAVKTMIERTASEKNEFARQSLLYGLGLVGDRAATAHLEGALAQTDAPAYVRGYAAAGLGLLGDEHAVRAIARVSRDSNYTITSDFLSELFRVL